MFEHRHERMHYSIFRDEHVLRVSILNFQLRIVLFAPPHHGMHDDGKRLYYGHMPEMKYRSHVQRQERAANVLALMQWKQASTLLAAMEKEIYQLPFLDSSRKPCPKHPQTAATTPVPPTVERAESTVHRREMSLTSSCPQFAVA